MFLLLKPPITKIDSKLLLPSLLSAVICFTDEQSCNYNLLQKVNHKQNILSPHSQLTGIQLYEFYFWILFRETGKFAFLKSHTVFLLFIANKSNCCLKSWKKLKMTIWCFNESCSYILLGFVLSSSKPTRVKTKKSNMYHEMYLTISRSSEHIDFSPDFRKEGKGVRL